MTRKAWYDFVRIGPCAVCTKRIRRQAHHIVRQQNLSKEYHYDLRNRMLVGSCCHYAHSSYGVVDRRIHFDKVPDMAILFAIDVLGLGPTIEYFCRYYQNSNRSLTIARIEALG